MGFIYLCLFAFWCTFFLSSQTSRSLEYHNLLAPSFLVTKSVKRTTSQLERFSAQEPAESLSRAEALRRANELPPSALDPAPQRTGSHDPWRLAALLNWHQTIGDQTIGVTKTIQTGIPSYSTFSDITQQLTFVTSSKTHGQAAPVEFWSTAAVKLADVKSADIKFLTNTSNNK